MNARKILPLMVVAAGLLAYQNSFTGTFVHDDFGSILENRTIRHLWPIWQPLLPVYRSGWTVAGRPLINLSLAINYAVGGHNVWGYHALNLTVHILAGLTLLGIVRRTLLQPRLRDRFGVAADELALATAVLWTVHPLQTESVTYIIQRAESIMGLFYLLTLYCFIRGVESPRVCLWHSLSVGACALGMTCKEAMASAPLLVLLYDWAFLSGSFREAWRRRWPLYLALASTWIVLGAVLAAAGNFITATSIAQRYGHTWWEYLATQMGVILYYLRLAVWPSPLSLDHAWTIARTWTGILPPAIAIVTLLGATVWAWRRSPAWGFVGAWFFLILAPSSSFIPLGNLIFEHRMYLPLAAVLGAVVVGFYSEFGRISLIVFLAMTIGLGFLTWRRNQEYRKNPDYNLALALATAGRFPEAIEYYERVLQITPNDAWLHLNLGVALYQVGKVAEAITHYEEALRLMPDFADAHYNLGIALNDQGNVADAIDHWSEALRIKPDFDKAHNNWGVALMRLGRVPEAIEHYKRAVTINPDFAEACNNLGTARLGLGQIQEAIQNYEQALRLKPDLADAHYNLGVALKQAGRLQEAVGHYQEALRIKPDYAEAHYNLGNTLLGLGHVPEAIEHYEKALQINHDFAEAHYNLGVALEQAGKTTAAIQEYEQALRINPDYAEAQNRLAHLRTAQ